MLDIIFTFLVGLLTCIFLFSIAEYPEFTIFLFIIFIIGLVTRRVMGL